MVGDYGCVQENQGPLKKALFPGRRIIMADATITISEEMMAQLEKCAAAAGQESGEDFAKMILQREIDKVDDAGSNDKIENRLRGLGYIS